MFNNKTIDRIKTNIFIALGDKDFLTRNQLIEALNRTGLKLSSSQFTRDVELLNQSSIKGFKHFKYSKGYDRTSCEAMIAYRSLATSRGRAQAVYHLNTIIKLIAEYDNKQQRHSATTTTIEVESIPF